MVSLVERVTNAIDALIEKEVERRVLSNNPLKLSSPREAARRLFKVDDLYWSNRRKGEDHPHNIQLYFENASDTKTTTISVKDIGIGQLGKDFSKTFVGLNSNNKVNKAYLIGTFGQGGSTSFRWCPYTLIVSRRPKLLKEKNEMIAFTVVKFDPLLDPTQDVNKAGTYQYLVDENEKVIQVKFKADLVPELYGKWYEGTIIKHIDYKLHFGVYTDLYSKIQCFLPDTILPYSINDLRDPTNPRPYRPVNGSFRNLNTNRNFLADSFRISPQDFGDVYVNFWIFNQDDNAYKNRKQVNQEWAHEGNVMFYTYHGQVHTARDKMFIEKEYGFEQISHDIIIQVNLDNLANIGFRNIITPHRSAFRKGELYDFIHEELKRALPEQDVINKIMELKLKKLQKVNLDDKLMKNIEKGFRGKLNYWKLKTIGPKLFTPGKLLDEIPEKKVLPVFNGLQVPSSLKINTKTPLDIWPGRRFSITLTSDAIDDYRFYKDVTSMIDNVSIKDSVLFTERNVSSANRGMFRVTYEIVNEKSLIGNKYNLIIKLPRFNRPPLISKIVLNVIEEPDKDVTTKKSNPRLKSDTSPNIRISYAKFDDRKRNLVGEVYESKGVLNIDINISYPDFDRTLGENGRLNKKRRTIEQLRSGYFQSIAVVLYQVYTDSKEDNNHMDLEWKNKVLGWSARGIINALIPGKL